MKIKDIIPVALGEEMPDVLIKNAKLVNVFTGEIEETNIALFRKRIAGIGDYNEGKEIIDLKGKYILPGFINAHLHIESSMLAPRQFAKAVLLRGTTTVIADPHEISNVLGLDGLEYMIKSTEGIPLNVYIAIPSAVPATNMETTGARLGPEDMVGFVDTYPNRIIALGEVMNFPGVLNRDPELLTKIEILRHKYKKIDGHAPGVTGKALNAYIDAFIRSDHECSTEPEALEKISKGMHVFIREGTAAKNLDDLIGAVNIMNHHNFSFCTDDREPLDILHEGDIDYLVRRSIQKGVDPIIAIRMATINTARYFNLRSMGAIAPGYKADMIVVDDLENLNIRMVIKDSKVVVKDGELVDEMKGLYDDLPKRFGKVILPEFSVEDLKVKPESNKMRVIEVFEGSLLTKELIVEPKVENGVVVSDIERDIIKIAIFERHTGSGFSKGFVKGFKLKSGAVGTSVGHDSHNIGIIGTNDEDMYIAAKEIERMNGGMVVVKDGKVLSRVPLPIAGLMADKELFEVVEELEYQEEQLKKLGGIKEVFMTLSFIQLAVIPELKITDRGLVDVNKQKFVELFV
ncbi:adenine deaminase [Marinitoga sp. 1135]|uniref:Adenine deaminase n=1 Tax=Marinitoga piezophila (strain DSM 14283 / JCM 11233 / KA3) TaxID=443254 RepID=H2J449_MARPK|nr:MULTISPECIES: adenine deaminase [Marinitoga]AEX85864.1 adenine deaminase [Marinitoga piezophila KA3]APT76300.1 adenine deaminase [Marinitoga sp. 1137]NUU96066.1 adenine deaminase [Marinitoga sp. 1135]NUU97977.1 adenine deaminase [Marinitoga sp. 1138]